MPRTSETLTARRIEATRAKPGERLELWDSEVKGLCLRVSSTARVWVFRYRLPDGTQPRHRLGEYVSADRAAELTRLHEAELVQAREEGRAVPAEEFLPLTLANVRLAARRLKVAVESGGDPAGAKRRALAEARNQPIRTMGDLAHAYFRACEEGEYRPRKKLKRTSTLNGERDLWRRHGKAALEALPVEAVTRATVKGLLRRIAANGPAVQGNRLRSLLRQLFNYAILEERVALNPVIGVEPVIDEEPRQRVLTDAELRATWAVLENPSDLRRKADGARVYVSRPVAIALQLAAITLQRRAEIAGMALSEIDLDRATWTIPPDRTKSRKAHLVPLPAKAVSLIREAIEIAPASSGGGEPSPFVFPSRRDPAKPLTPAALTHAIIDVFAAAGVVGARLHDLRRTGSTAMTSERLGISPFTRSLVLGHVNDPGGGAAISRSHYDANLYVSEKRRALEAWAALLLEIVGEAPRPSNVMHLQASA